MFRTTLAIFVLAYAVSGQSSPPSDSAAFPVRRVALYKSGVGYFEHLGQVHGSQEIAIRFTAGQLNDVLKSLTILDLGGGRIAGVNYGSVAPLERRLGDLHLPTGDKTTLTEFLAAMRGVRLEIRNTASTTSGRLLSIERKTRMGAGATLEVDYVSLVTDSGEVKTAEISPGFSVRILDRDIASNVDRYMDAIASSKDADLRRVTVATVGNGSRSLFVAYISEVPVWKTTYRLVLNSKQPKPLLQGWAIVDNTVGEDWTNVELSLIAGAPQSFVQRLSQPVYTRRPEVAVPQGFNPTPQTHAAAISYGGNRLNGTVADASGSAVANARVRAYSSSNALLADAFTDAQGRFNLYSIPQEPVRVEVESAGFKKAIINGVVPGRTLNVPLEVGSVSESLAVTAEAAQLSTETASISGARSNLGSGSALGSGTAYDRSRRSSLSSIAASGALAEARAQTEGIASATELGDLFQYKLKEPITIRKNQSALVPILQSPVDIEKVSIWSGARRDLHPQRAIWINNSSGVTLDGGTFSVIEDEAFAGEGLLDQVRAGERRLASYATDLALSVVSRQTTDSGLITRSRVSNGVISCHSEQRRKTTYIVRNEDASQRTVILEHPSRPEFELRGEAKPVESTREWHRFRLTVDPKQTATMTVEEAQPILATYQLATLSGDQITLISKQRAIPPELESSLRRILDQKQAVARLDDEIEALQAERSKIFDDQQRLRENLKSLKATAEEKALVQRYTQQLGQQEDRLQAIAKSEQSLETRKEREEEQLDALISRLTFEGTP